jgi:hypothetical protein
VQAVKDQSWDTSVKSLVAFPDVLKQLNEHLDWTQKLGDAMIGQQADVADSIQRLRGKAAAAGNLQSTPQQAVTTQGSGDNIQYIIEPANPETVYVPQYNPSWAYGPWPYPAYPPVYYPFGGALATGFFWGLGIAAGAALIGGWNWGGAAILRQHQRQQGRQHRQQLRTATAIDRDGWPAGRHTSRASQGRRLSRQRHAPALQPGGAPGADQREQFRGRLDGGQGAGNRPAAADRESPIARAPVAARATVPVAAKASPTAPAADRSTGRSSGPMRSVASTAASRSTARAPAAASR